VSVFRPVARVTAADGRDWELYAYRITLPARRRRAARLLLRPFWDLPRAALSTLGSDAWTIEAVSWVPHRTSYTWTTTGDYRRNVLAQVEGQLARGEVPKPRHATYLGVSG
jgi:hypothetical protein